MKNNFFKILFENLKTLFYALIIAVIIRSFFFQPFYIPSSSMEPTLLIGDRIFVKKFSYGYTKHSFPFSPPLFSNRVFGKSPDYGDLVVFKTPADNRTDYIKRLIGLPGDTIQFKNGKLFLNQSEILRTKINKKFEIRCGSMAKEVNAFREILPNGKEYVAVYHKLGSMQNTDDNRDCSKDSRYLSSVGYVYSENLVGKAAVIFFSNDTISGSILKFWNWDQSLRIKRFFNILK